MSVHAKDAKWSAQPGVAWGEETPLGDGDVGMERFIAKLKEIGYDGYITIEREISGDKQIEDIRAGAALLRSLIERSEGDAGESAAAGESEGETEA